MTSPKPTARTAKPKVAAKDDALYSFEHDGKTYTFAKPISVCRAPGWVRANRRRDTIDLLWTILEEIAGDEAMAAIDTMTEDEFNELQKHFEREYGQGV